MAVRLSLIAAALLLLGGCPKGPAKKESSGAGKLESGASRADAGPASDKPTPPPGELAFAADGPRPCVFHAGASAYFRCLSGADGTCFHYGASCEPADQCMFDPASGSYRQCRKGGEGRCAEYGDACQPADACYFASDDSRYHSCQKAASGRCTSYGDLCNPSAP
jgi:hypothetical protein